MVPAAAPTRPSAQEAGAVPKEKSLEGRARVPHVEYPFKLTVEHDALDLKGMFASAEAFDLYEVGGAAAESLGTARHWLCVDVIEVTPTTTTVHVTPTRPMSYAGIATETQSMVDGIAASVFPGGHVRGTRVQWIVSNTGIPSDMRGRLAVVH
ncbi:MAG: hypothetical protein ACYC2H_02435 [Thermoplasmatota archaeon]